MAKTVCSDLAFYIIERIVKNTQLGAFDKGANVVTSDDTHSKIIGYILWIFGFLGAHRFYFGRPISGTIYFFTLGLFLIGWIVDLFLIPGMDRDADRRYSSGNKDYTVTWVLLTFLGIFGLHRFYLGKWVTGLIWLLTGGLCLFGLLYDLWTLNGQIDDVNRGRV